MLVAQSAHIPPSLSSNYLFPLSAFFPFHVLLRCYNILLLLVFVVALLCIIPFPCRGIFQSCCWASPAESFSGLSPAGLMSKFYCLNIWGSPNQEGQVPVFISPRNRVAQLYPHTLGLPNLFTYYYYYYMIYLMFCIHCIYSRLCPIKCTVGKTRRFVWIPLPDGTYSKQNCFTVFVPISILQRLWFVCLWRQRPFCLLWNCTGLK
jgi:hypothetical protein